MTIKTIVAAIARENGDEPVAHRAIQLAQEHEARLIFVHVIESVPAPDPHLPLPADEKAVSRVLMADAVESVERIIASAGGRAEISVEFGKADELIERLARDYVADLLVIGVGKPQNLREKLFGSTADRLVRSSPCPVLVVKRRVDGPYRRMVAGIDFSPMSLAAAQTAARIVPNAALELVHALEISLAFEQAMLKAGTSQAEMDRYRHAKAQAARKELRSAWVTLSMPSRSKIRVVHGDAATILVRLARSGKTDLVALGIQGRSAISKMVLGSVARKVIAASSCDVLLAKETV